MLPLEQLKEWWIDERSSILYALVIGLSVAAFVYLAFAVAYTVTSMVVGLNSVEVWGLRGYYGLA